MSDKTLKIFAVAVLVLVVVCLQYFNTAQASQQICNQFNNNQITCQNYDDSGTYENQSYYQRNGNSNSWSGTEDQENLSDQ